MLAHLSSVVLSANVKCGRKTQNFSCASTTRVLHKQPTTHRTAKPWQQCRKVKTPKNNIYKLWLPGQKRKRRKLFCLGLFFHRRKQDAYEATCNPGREGTRQISQYKYTPIYTENENLTGEPQDSSVCDGALGLWRYAVLGILNLTVTWPRFVPLRRRCKNEDCTEELKRCKSSLRKKKCWQCLSCGGFVQRQQWRKKKETWIEGTKYISGTGFIKKRGLKESEYERTRNHLGAGKHKGSFF